MEVIHKIGRRKTSVARVYMSEGKGNITVNKKTYSDFLVLQHYSIKFFSLSVLQKQKINLTYQ